MLPIPGEVADRCPLIDASDANTPQLSLCAFSLRLDHAQSSPLKDVTSSPPFVQARNLGDISLFSLTPTTRPSASSVCSTFSVYPGPRLLSPFSLLPLGPRHHHSYLDYCSHLPSNWASCCHSYPTTVLPVLISAPLQCSTQPSQ